MTAEVMTWQATAWVAAGLLMIRSTVGLFTEWQSRRTLVAVAHAAPAGLITIHRDSSGRQILCLAWVANPGRCEQRSRS